MTQILPLHFRDYYSSSTLLLLSTLDRIHVEVMHRAWSTPTWIVVSHAEWQKNFFYTQVIVKLAQLIDVFMQNEELLCSKL